MTVNNSLLVCILALLLLPPQTMYLSSYNLWGTVPSVGNVAQPPLRKPVGSKVGGQDPRPWISSPVGNQACIALRLL